MAQYLWAAPLPGTKPLTHEPQEPFYIHAITEWKITEIQMCSFLKSISEVFPILSEK